MVRIYRCPPEKPHPARLMKPWANTDLVYNGQTESVADNRTRNGCCLATLEMVGLTV